MKTNSWMIRIATAALSLSVFCSPLQARRVYSGATLVKKFDFGSSSCRGMVMTSDGATVWVADAVSKVHVMSVADLTHLHSYNVPAVSIWNIAITPDDTKLCVPGRDNALLSLLDTATGAQVTGWPINAPRPQSIVIDRLGQYAYTANVPYPSGSSDWNHSVSIVDLASRTIVGSIPIGHESYPIALQFTADGENLLVVESWANRVTVIRISDRTIINRIPVGSTPTGIAIDGQLAYVNSGPGAPGLDAVTVFDLTDVIHPLKLAEFSVASVGVSTWGGLRVSRDGYAFMTDAYGKQVIVVDVRDGYRIVATIPVGGSSFPGDVLLASDARRLFVSDVNNGVQVFDLSYVLPIALCRDVVVGVDAGACFATVTAGQVDNGSFDPDGDPLTATLTPPGPYPVGKTMVTLTVTDPEGSSAACSASITVSDTAAPVPNLTSLPPIVGQCSASLPAAPTATDACDGIVTATTTAPAAFGQGDFAIVWVYTDSHGNSATQDQWVHVHDTIPPIIGVTENLVLPATSPNGAVASFAAPTADDNCSGVVPVTCNPASASKFPIGITSVSCTAVDAAGNTAATSFTVRVKGANEQLFDVILLVRSMPIQPSVKAELTERLLKALFEPTKACGELADLTRYIQRQAGKKLTPAQAQQLQQEIARIRNVLACS